LIEDWYKKRLIFADPLLPCGTVGETHAHRTHLQITQSNPQPKVCKRVLFLYRHLISTLRK